MGRICTDQQHRLKWPPLRAIKRGQHHRALDCPVAKHRALKLRREKNAPLIERGARRSARSARIGGEHLQQMRNQRQHLDSSRVGREPRADAEPVQRCIERGHPHAKRRFTARPRRLCGEQALQQLHGGGRHALRLAQRRANARDVVAMHRVFNRRHRLVALVRRQIIKHERRLQPIEHGAARQAARHRLDPAHHRRRR